jgi:Zn-dependent protease
MSGLFLVLYYFVLINVILAVFNMIPIPPLDGSGIVMGFLSPEAAEKYERIQPYGFFIVLLLLMTGIIGRILGFVMGIVNMLIF